MIHNRVMLAMIGISIFVCWQWPSQAVAQVSVDVGGVHVRVGQPPSAGTEALTRGPIHEAFAQPVVMDESRGFTITRKPPAAVEEIPPDLKPDGDNIDWIPGYWSWDSDRDDFIWVSGCWRAVPPNTSWVPGYWSEAKGGYQWVAGFWTTADTEELEYLPSPPASLEEGPQGTGSADSIWIPGVWVRVEGRYAWRPGFWEQARADWVWEPAHYVCSPRGCIYVAGYWDYPLDRRGLAFLPAYFPASVYGARGFSYSPEYALDLGVLMQGLFISPWRHAYYFGDYYGSEYSRDGFYPWYEARDHRDWYDPIFVHQQWQHRGDRRWLDDQRAEFDRRRDDKALRPARTYDAMRAQVARLPAKERQQILLARPMKDVVSDKTAPFKFGTLDARTREALVSHSRDVHAYTGKRAQWESPSAVPKPSPLVTPKEPAATPKELPTPPPRTPEGGVVPGERPAGTEVQPLKVKIPKSPIGVRETTPNKELAPPPIPKHPNPDLSAKPRAPKSDTPDRTKEKGGSDKPE